MSLDSYYSSSHYLSSNVKITISYASNPLFVGDTIKALITIQHIDPDPVEDNLSTLNNDNHDDLDNGSTDNEDRLKPESSWSRKISSQFSRSLYLSLLEESEMKLMDLNKFTVDTSETFLSGSLQIFGHFSFDGEVVDLSKFSKLRQSSIISGCIAGIPSLKVSSSTFHSSKSFFHNFSSSVSSFLKSDIGDLSNLMFEGVSTSNIDPLESINPLFVTNQLLMFPSLTLKPAQQKQYYLEFKLPNTLPPSYHSKNININYNLIFNTERITSLSSTPLNINIPFPLKIMIAPKPNGVQVVPMLHNEFKLNRRYFNSKISKQIMLTELPTRKDNTLYQDFSFVESLLKSSKANTVNSISEEPATLDTESENQKNKNELLKSEFIYTMKTLFDEDITTTEQIKSLPSSTKMGKFNANIASPSGSSLIDNHKESSVQYFDSSTLDAKECIEKLSASIIQNDDLLSTKLLINDTMHDYKPVIIQKALKTSFLVKFKNKFTTKVIFDKPFYKIGENISLCFDFINQTPNVPGPNIDNRFIVSGISVSLESTENIKYEYLNEYQVTVEEIYKQFQTNPKEAYKVWKLPPPASGNYKSLSLEEINLNEIIHRELIDRNPNYWKKFSYVHWVKKYSLQSNSFQKFNINDLFLSYNLVPQFSTDVFELKYFLCFKFVIIDDSRENEKQGDANKSIFLKNTHNDNNGRFYSVKDSLNGSVFTIRLPFNILASQKDFGNISV